MKKAVEQTSKPTAFQPILALDLVRACAAIMVFLVHARGGTWIHYGGLPPDQQTPLTFAFFFITRLGHEAVLVFFVLSGFLVGGRLIDRVRADSFRILDYALDRITRILVPLVPACIFTVLLNRVVFSEPISLGQTLLNMVGLNHGLLAQTLNNNAPLWSLAYEIWFYIAGGATAALLMGLRPISAFLVIGISGLVFAQLGEAYLIFWIMGSLTALIRGTRHRSMLFAIGIIAVAIGTLAYQLGSGSKSTTVVAFMPEKVAEALLCLGFCLCIPVLHSIKLNHWLSPFSKIITFASAMSYSLYLFHYPILSVLNLAVFPQYTRIDYESLGVFALKIGVTLGICAALYFTFERNTQLVRTFLKSTPASAMAGPWKWLRMTNLGQAEPTGSTDRNTPSKT